MGQRPLGSFLLAARSREVDGERRPPSGLAVDEHQPAMRLHGPLHDCQPETRATYPPGSKGLEQAALQLVREAGSVIAHAQRNGVIDAPAPGHAVPSSSPPPYP